MTHFWAGIIGQEETMNSEDMKKKTRPLKLKKKIYEFYSAPITKEWANPSEVISAISRFNYLFFFGKRMNP
jgi:hypothetical protein